MSDLWSFLVSCWTSGTLLRSVCALVIIPTAAWLAIWCLKPGLARASSDPVWQAPLAAAAASIPGLLLVILASAALLAGADASCRSTLAGQVLFTIVVSITAFSFVRALVLAVARLRAVDRLVRASTPAAGRLAQIAREARMSVRVVNDDSTLCVLARILRPVVIISSGALAWLSERELSAALYHERGHARRGDQAIAFALSFLVDLLPLPARDLVEMYGRARELAADSHALHAVEADDLAAALLRFVKPRRVLAGTCAFGGDDTVKARLHVLLRDSSPARFSIRTRLTLSIALATVLAIGIAPAAATLIFPVPCDMHARVDDPGSM